MKKNIFIFLAIVFASVSCRNDTQNLTADVEIPVSVQDVTLKSIEEFVNTSGTVYPKGDIELKSEITANYFLEKNPRTGKTWQLNDKVIAGDLIARLEDREYINSIKMETTRLNLDLTESELKKQESLYENS
jgi:membrane fusion protein (multidrug efflux system)